MAPLRILRVEHKQTRIGPFRAGPFSHYGGPNQLDALKMPSPLKDLPPDSFNPALVFGFLHEDDLHWFTSHDRALLKKKGFVLSTYLAPVKTVVLGTHQCAFNPEQAILAGEEKL